MIELKIVFLQSHLQQRAMAILVDWCFTDVEETDSKKTTTN